MGFPASRMLSIHPQILEFSACLNMLDPEQRGRGLKRSSFCPRHRVGI